MNKKRHLGILYKAYLCLGTIFFVFLAIFFSYYGILETIDYQISDMIYQAINYQKAETAVKIISIDDTTIEKLGNYQDWSRNLTSKLINTLNQSDYAPAVIGIDLDYTETKDSFGDQELVNTCKNYNNVCFSAYVSMEPEPTEKSSPFNFFKKKHTDSQETAMDTSKKKADLSALSSKDLDSIEEIAINTSISMPFSDLLPYVSIGVVNNVKNSSDGFIRNAITSITIDTEDNEELMITANMEYDSFAVATYKMYMDSLGKTYSLPKVDENNSFTFTYTRQSKDYSIYSFYDVISGNVDLSIFKDSIVYIGDYTESDSTFKAPNQKNIQMQEVEVQANILEALLTQKTGQPISRFFRAIFYSIFAAIFFLATSYSSNKRTIIAAICLFLFQFLVCAVLNIFGYYILILIPASLVVIITIVNLNVRYWIAKYHSYKMETTFKKYVDESVVNEIVTNGASTRRGGVKKDIAVLFVDIRGFTSLSESLEPEQIVEILNQYLTLAANAVAKNQGTLDKFIGDAAMAVFNSPFDLEDYEYKAVCAAWELLSSAQELNQFCQKQYGKQVTFGIGIQCGEAVIGNIGCESRMDYTAIGDTVNTASRLEGAAAPGQILISEEMNQRLQGRIETSFAGEFTLKGKKNSVPAYIVQGVWLQLPEKESLLGLKKIKKTTTRKENDIV